MDHMIKYGGKFKEDHWQEVLFQAFGMVGVVWNRTSHSGVQEKDPDARTVYETESMGLGN